MGVVRKSAGAAALSALVVAAVLPGAAGGRVTYPGPRFGVPFQLRLSGSVTKRWQIVEHTVFCEYSGSGSQTVTFHTKGWVRARVFSVDRLHPARADFYELEGDVPLVLTVQRVDATTQNPSDTGRPCGMTPPHNCGPARTVTIPTVPVRARNHRLELDLQQNGTPGPLADAVNRLYPDTANCRYPSPEDMISSRVPWPGNRRFLRPGSHGGFTVRQSATRLGSVTSSDTQLSWATSEQYSARFTLRTRNRCAVAPASVRRRVGYVCRARNGTVLAG